MAVTSYFMQATANDLNAGSTNADSASVTDVGGTYTQGTGAGGNDVYLATGGTPFSGLTANVSRVSIYTAGATVLTFTALVTAINTGGLSIDVSITDFMGVRPASASTKTCKVDGAWASSKAITSLGAVTIPNSIIVNIKAAGATYASQASQTWALAGAAGKFPWYRGYKTTVGDLDACRPQDIANWDFTGVACPLMTYSSNNLLINGADSLVTGIAFTSAGVGAACLRLAAARGTARRCISIATGANALANAISITGNGGSIELCFGKSNALANVVSATGAPAEIRGCYLKGGLSGVSFTGATGIYKTIFDTNGSDAISQAGNVTASIYDNTIYSPTGHGVALVSNLALAVSICGNLFHTVNQSSKYCVDFTGSTDVGGVDMANNSVYNCNAGTDANGFSTGLGDIQAFDTVTEATNPLPNAASHNFVYAGTTGVGYGLPAFFFDTDDAVSFLSNRAPGATNQAASGGSAGMLYIPSMDGL